jgi:hypothetical protein
MSRGSGHRLLVEVSFGTATCPSAPDLASLSRWALVLPRVPQPRISSAYWGELRRCHVSHSSGPYILVEVSSAAATCPTTRGSAFLRGEVRCCHVSPGPRRAVDHMNKKSLSCPIHAVRLACFQGTLLRYRSACKTCNPLQCDSIVQCRPSWPLMYMSTVVVWPDRTTPWVVPRSVQQSNKTGRLHIADVVQNIIYYS